MSNEEDHIKIHNTPEHIQISPGSPINLFILNADQLSSQPPEPDCPENVQVELVDSVVVPDGYTGVFTVQDLRDMENDLTGKYYLMNDLDLSDWGNWEPLGLFTGEFNGGGHVIRNFSTTIDVDGISGNRGLFTTMQGVFKYTGFINAYHKGVSSSYSAVIAGRIDGEVQNCYIDGNNFETGGDRAGGLLGYTNGGVFTNCYVSIEVLGSGSRVGQFLAYSDANTTTSCYRDSTYGDPGLTGDNSVEKTPEELKQEATFTGWDFDNIWEIDEGNDFPRLRKGIV